MVITDKRTELILELPEALLSLLTTHHGILSMFETSDVRRQSSGLNLIKAITSSVKFKVLSPDANQCCQLFVDVKRSNLIDGIANTIDGLTLARSRKALSAGHREVAFIDELLGLERDLRAVALIDLGCLKVKSFKWAGELPRRFKGRFVDVMITGAINNSIKELREKVKQHK